MRIAESQKWNYNRQLWNITSGKAKGDLQRTGGHEKIKPFHGNCASIVMQHKARTILFGAGASMARPSTPSPSVSEASQGGGALASRPWQMLRGDGGAALVKSDSLSCSPAFPDKTSSDARDSWVLLPLPVGPWPGLISLRGDHLLPLNSTGNHHWTKASTRRASHLLQQNGGVKAMLLYHIQFSVKRGQQTL